MYADAHCHLADPRFDKLRPEMLERAQAAQIKIFLQGGVDPADWRRQDELAGSGWYRCYGLHPWFVNEADEQTCDAALKDLEGRLRDATALGELGLDRGPRLDPMAYPRQIDMFEKQLHLAIRHDKPLVLHVVRAHAQALTILASFKRPWRGIVHGFNASFEVGSAYLDMGLGLSVGGALTRPGYKKLKNAIGRFPMERILVESDAPDMAPATYGRCFNEPESVWLVASALGKLTNQAAESVLAQSSDNLRRIFALELQ